MKRIISVLIAAFVLAGSMSYFVFAEGEAATPVAVNDLKAYSAYKGVALEWTPVEGATKYIVYRNGKKVKTVKPTSKYYAYDNKNKLSYYNKTNTETTKKYKYYVRAVFDGKEGPKSKTVKKEAFVPLYIQVTFNRTRTLTSHDSAKRTRTFKAGTTVKAHNSRFGRYIFRYKGNVFHVNYTSLKGFKAKINKKRKYSNKEAEYFANTAKISSKKKYMVLASLYTQRLFVLKGSKGKWRVAKGLNKNGVKAYKWGISSGMSTSPTAQGLQFAIYKRLRSRRGVNYLSFHFSAQSLHGKVGNQGFDTLRSGGCIRNPDKYAMLLYSLPIGTRVSIY